MPGSLASGSETNFPSRRGPRRARDGADCAGAPPPPSPGALGPYCHLGDACACPPRRSVYPWAPRFKGPGRAAAQGFVPVGWVFLRPSDPCANPTLLEVCLWAEQSTDAVGELRVTVPVR
ncbi:unnamed protein product [Boreogadus saida]